MREIVGVLYSLVDVLETIAEYLAPETSGTTSVQGETREEAKEEEVVVKKTTRSK